MSGLLGALGGLGQGMSQVGEQWAQDLKTKRVEELRRTLEIDKELRGEKRVLAKEGRDEKRELDKEGRDEKRKATDREADLEDKKTFERFKADMARTEEGQKPTEALRKYNEMIAKGEDPKVAYETAYRTTYIQGDPMGLGFIGMRHGGDDVSFVVGPTKGEDGEFSVGLTRPKPAAEPAGPPPEGSIGRKGDGQLYIVEKGEARLMTAEEKRERGIR